MKVKYLIIVLILMSTINLSTASNPYGEVYTYDVYYNDRLLPGTEVAKPVLKIGEPFTIAINLTVYQKCYASIMLSQIGDNDFEIITGSTSRMNDYGTEILDKNSTKMYKWTVTATDNWVGGTLPLDLVYQINDFETGKILVNSGFTVAYPYISNEYYEGKAPVSKQSATETKSNTKSTPAFTAIGALLSVALALAVFRR